MKDFDEPVCDVKEDVDDESSSPFKFLPLFGSTICNGSFPFFASRITGDLHSRIFNVLFRSVSLPIIVGDDC